MNDIILTTINAKWIHPSLALRLLKANLGRLEEKCEIIEFNLRQPLNEKITPLLAAHPRILGISVSIWNHLATIELLKEMRNVWAADGGQCLPKPVIVLGGPEVTVLSPNTEIFEFADYVIRGEGEEAFRLLCENILTGAAGEAQTSYETKPPRRRLEFINASPVNLEKIKSAYHLYTDEDITKKLIYVESSRGCPFNCEFCMSAEKGTGERKADTVREFPLEVFLAQMDELVKRGVKTFKFLDRSFNINIKRALKIIRFFLEKIEEIKAQQYTNTALPPHEAQRNLTVHFEMVPSIFPDELREALSRFPPDSLRLEIGIQSLNREVCARISRPSDPEKELETLRFLSEKTNAIIHADLIAGLPGEDLASLGSGFDRLWLALQKQALSPKASSVPQNELCPQRPALSPKASSVPNDRLCPQNTALSPKTGSVPKKPNHRFEIQLGILKMLPGTSILRHKEAFNMRCNPLPPYEIEETAAISADHLGRIRNFARFWELIVNHGLVNFASQEPVFHKFMALSDALFTFFGRNWGIDRAELRKILEKKEFHAGFMQKTRDIDF